MSYLDDDLPPAYSVEIGEIPVDIRPVWCCGMLAWYGRFPDGTACCKYAEHASADDAERCARRRVEAGFVVRSGATE